MRCLPRSSQMDRAKLAFTTQKHIQSILKANSEYIFMTLIIPKLYFCSYIFETPFLSLSKGSWRSSLSQKSLSVCKASAEGKFMSNFFFFKFVFALLIFTSWKIYRNLEVFCIFNLTLWLHISGRKCFVLQSLQRQMLVMRRHLGTWKL